MFKKDRNILNEIVRDPLYSPSVLSVLIAPPLPESQIGNREKFYTFHRYFLTFPFGTPL